MSATTPASDYLSRDEIRAAVASMSDADGLRLEKVARWLSRNRRLEPDDLLQTALTRALEGTRRCPRTIGLVRFFVETMRSIASDDVKARKRKPELHLVPKVGGDDIDDGIIEFDFPDPSPNAEELLADEQDYDLIAKRILALFEDDVVAQAIIEGEMEGMEAYELRELTNLDAKAFASKRRLMRRRIDKEFPKGWTR